MPLNNCSVAKVLLLNILLKGASYAFAPPKINIHPNHDTVSCRSCLCLSVHQNGSEQRSVVRRNKQRLQFIRILPRNSRGNRRLFELQTAVITLHKAMPNGVTSIIDLHLQIHFGDGSYFDFYNNREEFGSKYEKIFYEMIVVGRLRDR
jgi:hypothetical protein